MILPHFSPSPSLLSSSSSLLSSSSAIIRPPPRRDPVGFYSGATAYRRPVQSLLARPSRRSKSPISRLKLGAQTYHPSASPPECESAVPDPRGSINQTCALPRIVTTDCLSARLTYYSSRPRGGRQTQRIGCLHTRRKRRNRPLTSRSPEIPQYSRRGLLLLPSCPSSQILRFGEEAPPPPPWIHARRLHDHIHALHNGRSGSDDD